MVPKANHAPPSAAAPGSASGQPPNSTRNCSARRWVPSRLWSDPSASRRRYARNRSPIASAAVSPSLLRSANASSANARRASASGQPGQLGDKRYAATSNTLVALPSAASRRAGMRRCRISASNMSSRWYSFCARGIDALRPPNNKLSRRAGSGGCGTGKAVVPARSAAATGSACPSPATRTARHPARDSGGGNRRPDGAGATPSRGSWGARRAPSARRERLSPAPSGRVCPRPAEPGIGVPSHPSRATRFYAAGGPASVGVRHPRVNTVLMECARFRAPPQPPGAFCRRTPSSAARPALRAGLLQRLVRPYPPPSGDARRSLAAPPPRSTPGRPPRPGTPGGRVFFCGPNAQLSRGGGSGGYRFRTSRHAPAVGCSGWFGGCGAGGTRSHPGRPPPSGGPTAAPPAWRPCPPGTRHPREPRGRSRTSD